MILRRFMQHVREQNWFAVGLDVIVVVVGIFLGLQVQASYEKHKQGVDIENMHKNLEQDFDYIIEQANYRLEFTVSLLEDMKYFVQVVRSPDMHDYDEERIARALEAGDYNIGNPETSPTWSALVSTGREYYIENEELKKALIEYHRSVVETRDSFQEIRMAMVEFDRIFQRHYVLKNDFETNQKLKDKSYLLGLASWDMEAMRADLEFQRAAGRYMKLQFYYASNNNNNLESAKVVLALLRDSK